ncbi:hypothetical protein [Phytoactinopolyspora limicola]|uniref:hypothetical protein n=1 Tax=Phytoactinopolyspora limicola TaxID=2715536 RepID=UPI00140C8E6B|nr:hypothetical protein [Phytoactinopolyspora limicola]
MSAAKVIDLVRKSGATEPEDLRDPSVGLIARLLLTGLVVAGEVDGSGHVPWDCSAAEAMVRIVEDWNSRSDPFVMPGEIVWLDTTLAGHKIGEIVWRRELPG